MSKSGEFEIVFFGNPITRRTEAEVSLERELVALAYESPSGWRTELRGPAASSPEIPGLAQAIEDARDQLSHFVNRVGRDVPPGLDPMGLSLWLMQRDDSDLWRMGR